MDLQHLILLILASGLIAVGLLVELGKVMAQRRHTLEPFEAWGMNIICVSVFGIGAVVLLLFLR